MDCLFCKIAQKEIPADIVYEDEDLLAFKDINPTAPVHVLIIPKKHIATLLDLQQEDIDIMGKIVLAAKKIALQLGLGERGFRLVSNCKEEAGQTVFHIHFHLLGGRAFEWPAG